jgi:hypothetical protein
VPGPQIVDVAEAQRRQRPGGGDVDDLDRCAHVIATVVEQTDPLTDDPVG